MVAYLSTPSKKIWFYKFKFGGQKCSFVRTNLYLLGQNLSNCQFVPTSAQNRTLDNVLSLTKDKIRLNKCCLVQYFAEQRQNPLINDRLLSFCPCELNLLNGICFVRPGQNFGTRILFLFFGFANLSISPYKLTNRCQFVIYLDKLAIVQNLSICPNH